MDNYYKVWKNDKIHGNMFFDRSIGKTEEMESSKALCKVISPFYKPKMKLLDVGCGTGQYLRSLRKRTDKNIDYTGLDVTEYFIELAKKGFKDVPFYVGDIYNLRFKDNEFDMTICNNVILHLPPKPKEAIAELIRVSSKYIVIRTTFAKRNYIIKEVRGCNDNLNEEELGQIPERESKWIDNGEPLVWNYFNLYTKQFLKDLVEDIDNNCKVTFVDDTFWKELTNMAKTETATEIIGNKQVSGNIILDWKFLIIEKV